MRRRACLPPRPAFTSDYVLRPIPILAACSWCEIIAESQAASSRAPTSRPHRPCRHGSDAGRGRRRRRMDPRTPRFENRSRSSVGVSSAALWRSPSGKPAPEPVPETDACPLPPPNVLMPALRHEAFARSWRSMTPRGLHVCTTSSPKRRKLFRTRAGLFSYSLSASG